MKITTKRVGPDKSIIMVYNHDMFIGMHHESVKVIDVFKGYEK